eukprot:1161623-Pelagomonas_calceolata.AAC.3
MGHVSNNEPVRCLEACQEPLQMGHVRGGELSAGWWEGGGGYPRKHPQLARARGAELLLSLAWLKCLGREKCQHGTKTRLKELNAWLSADRLLRNEKC